MTATRFEDCGCRIAALFTYTLRLKWPLGQHILLLRYGDEVIRLHLEALEKGYGRSVNTCNELLSRANGFHVGIAKMAA